MADVCDMHLGHRWLALVGFGSYAIVADDIGASFHLFAWGVPTVLRDVVQSAVMATTKYSAS